MRNTFLILLHTFFCLISCGFVDKDIKKEAEKLLIGRWVLTTDTNFVVDIRIDSIVYYYNGQVDMSNPINFVFKDSLNAYYETKYSRFDFMRNGELLSKISIKEFETIDMDTIVNIVVYLDKKGLDIVSRNISVSFRRLEN